MEQRLLTMAETKKYFQIKDTRTINKFIKQGLKYIPIRNERKKVWYERHFRICRNAERNSTDRKHKSKSYSKKSKTQDNRFTKKKNKFRTKQSCLEISLLMY